MAAASAPAQLIEDMKQVAANALNSATAVSDALDWATYLPGQTQVFARPLSLYQPVIAPTVPTLPPLPDPNDLTIDFAQALQQVQDVIDGLQTSWLRDYFPAALPDGLDPLLSDIISGAMVDATTQEIMWERAKAQTLRDAARYEDSIVTQWASRGFSMPGGVVNNQLQMRLQDTHFTNADMAAQQAIKALDIHVEAVKFAADTGVKLKIGLLNGISGLVTAYSRLPSAAAEYASAVAEAKRTAYAAVTDYYRAIIASADIQLRASIAGADSDLRYSALAGGFIGNITASGVEAQKARLDMYARTAAAAYSSFNAVAATTSTVASSGA
jgi:hypothetical protein